MVGRLHIASILTSSSVLVPYLTEKRCPSKLFPFTLVIPLPIRKTLKPAASDWDPVSLPWLGSPPQTLPWPDSEIQAIMEIWAWSMNLLHQFISNIVHIQTINLPHDWIFTSTASKFRCCVRTAWHGDIPIIFKRSWCHMKWNGWDNHPPSWTLRLAQPWPWSLAQWRSWACQKREDCEEIRQPKTISNFVPCPSVRMRLDDDFLESSRNWLRFSSGISENNSRNHYDECACMHLFSSCEKKNISDASKWESKCKISAESSGKAARINDWERERERESCTANEVLLLTTAGDSFFNSILVEVLTKVPLRSIQAFLIIPRIRHTGRWPLSIVQTHLE